MPSFQQRLQAELTQGIGGLLAGGGVSLDDAFKQVTADMLANNPFVPPKGCPVNDLPTELLAHIFLVGSQMDAEGSDDDEDDEDDDDDFELDDESAVGPRRTHAHRDPEGAKDDEGDMDWDAQKKGGRKEHTSTSGAGSEDSEHEAHLPFQVLVSHVCKYWRQVAIDSPVLWTNITFTEGPPFERSITWIERSKGLSLHIDIDCTRPADGDPNDDDIDEPDVVEPPPFFSLDDLSAILDIITPHVQRWHALEVMVNLYEYMHLVLTRLAQCECAPLLEVLQLYHYEDCDEYEAFPLTQFKAPLRLFHGNAPNLKHTALWGVHVAWDDGEQGEGPELLSGLIDLELAYHAKDVRPSWAAFAHMLRSSPDLKSLTLCLSGPAGQPSDWPDVIELPSVQDLVLCYHEPEYIGPLLERLFVPNVTSLALDYDEGDYSEFARQLARAPAGKSKSLLAGLDNLKISGLLCDRKAIDIMYEQLANLKTLNLNCSCLDDDFFEKLKKPVPSASSSAGVGAKGATPMYCPQLHTITTTGIDGADMRSFVEARRAAGIPIKKVFMSEVDQIEEREEKWLREHVESLEFFEPSDSEEELDGDDIIEIDEDDADAMATDD